MVSLVSIFPDLGSGFFYAHILISRDRGQFKQTLKLRKNKKTVLFLNISYWIPSMQQALYLPWTQPL